MSVIAWNGIVLRILNKICRSGMLRIQQLIAHTRKTETSQNSAMVMIGRENNERIDS